MFCLKVATDRAWAANAVRASDAVLVDHAHCELKAASNALSLVARHPGDPEITRVLAALAAEEIEHFQRVLAVLSARSATLGRPPVDAYAAELRRAAAHLPRDRNDNVLLDRLLVGALIEARSCERFQLLVEATQGSADLAEAHSLWKELFAAEARHYRTFVELAVRAAGGSRARALDRLERLAFAEADIVTALARSCESRASVHG